MQQQALPELLLSSKATAELIGLSVYTLQRARSDRMDLDMPPAQLRGRRVGYALTDLLQWARRRGVRLRWATLPVSYAVPAAEAIGAATAPLPAELAERLRLARLYPCHKAQPAPLATTPAAQRP